MLDAIEKYHRGSEKRPFVEVQLSSGKTGLLKPIRTMPLCLNCHGSTIDPELYSVIQKKYPKDKAIDYKVGEIRGFFWATY